MNTGLIKKVLFPEFTRGYLICASVNGEDWSLVVDYGTKKTDTPHDYIEFEEPFKARYIKLQNKEYMVSENFPYAI